MSVCQTGIDGKMWHPEPVGWRGWVQQCEGVVYQLNVVCIMLYVGCRYTDSMMHVCKGFHVWESLKWRITDTNIVSSAFHVRKNSLLAADKQSQQLLQSKRENALSLSGIYSKWSSQRYIGYNKNIWRFLSDISSLFHILLSNYLFYKRYLCLYFKHLENMLYIIVIYIHLFYAVAVCLQLHVHPNNIQSQASQCFKTLTEQSCIASSTKQQ